MPRLANSSACLAASDAMPASPALIGFPGQHPGRDSIVRTAQSSPGAGATGARRATRPDAPAATLAALRLPYSAGSYSPSWVEWSLLAGTVAMVALLFMAWARLFPLLGERPEAGGR